MPSSPLNDVQVVILVQSLGLVKHLEVAILDLGQCLPCGIQILLCKWKIKNVNVT